MEPILIILACWILYLLRSGPQQQDEDHGAETEAEETPVSHTDASIDFANRTCHKIREAVSTATQKDLEALL